MSLQFVFGGSGRGKTYYMQHFMTEQAALHTEKEYIMIVPEQFTMQTQKELITLSEHHGIMNIDVQSFLRLAFRVFGETGAGKEPVLDDMGKTMILKKVLSEKKDELEYFGKNIDKKGYITQIKSFISELIQYDVNYEQLDKMISASEKKPVLAKKLSDMSVAYRSFLEYIDKHYITSEEVITVLTEVVSQSKILKDSVICLDGFTGFTPLQYKLIAQLLNVADKVCVSVCIDDRESVAFVGAKHRLFHMSQKMIWHLRNIAKDNQIEVCEDIWVGKKEESTRFSNSKVLSALERNMFRYPFTVYKEQAEDISVCVLRQPENEVSYAIQEIKRLLREEQCRYRDIAVIAGDLGTYGVLIESAMEQAGFPCFIDQKKSVLANPFVVMIDSLLDIFIRDFAYEDIMKYIKGNLSGITDEQTDLIDNFLLASGVRGHGKWKEEWECDYIFRKCKKDDLVKVRKQLNDIRMQIFDEIMPLYETVAKGTHSVHEYSELICTFLEKKNVYAAIMKQADAFMAEGEPELAREYEQIYEIVLSVFDRLTELLGEEEMKLAEFKELLDVGFSEARIGLIPPGVDQILAGDISRTRISDVKYLFFLGMNDTNISKGGSSGGILSDSERVFLSEGQFELAPTSREQVYTDQFYLYLNMTKPSKHLYITYSETGNDGRAQNPSYIIDRLKKIFPMLKVQVMEEKDSTTDILHDDMGLKYLIKGLREGSYQNDKWQEIFRHYKSDETRQDVLAKLLDAAFGTEGESSISKAAAKALYREILRGSTSQFERYAACAFSYFMQYGLKLEERTEHQVEFFDIGNIVHEALELYTQKLMENGKQWQDLDESSQHVLANQCLNEVVEQYKNGLLYDTERDTYMITRLRRLLLRTVWAVTEQMKLGKFSTVESEFGFDIAENGQVSGEDIDNPDYMQLIGRIDRVDSYENAGKTYVKIVDYKTGKKELSLSDLYYGLQMQLIIYLRAAMEKAGEEEEKRIVIPAGVLYYNIEDPILSGKQDEALIEKEMLKQLRPDGIVNEDDPILPAFDGNFATDTGELPVKLTSLAAPFATDKDGMLKKQSGAVTTKDFDNLIRYTRKNIYGMSRNIMNGDTRINPYKKADSSGKTACMYCNYRGICRFDVRNEGSNYRVLKKLSDDDVLRMIEE